MIKSPLGISFRFRSCKGELRKRLCYLPLTDPDEPLIYQQAARDASFKHRLHYHTALVQLWKTHWPQQVIVPRIENIRDKTGERLFCEQDKHGCAYPRSISPSDLQRFKEKSHHLLWIFVFSPMEIVSSQRQHPSTAKVHQLPSYHYELPKSHNGTLNCDIDQQEMEKHPRS